MGCFTAKIMIMAYSKLGKNKIKIVWKNDRKEV